MKNVIDKDIEDKKDKMIEDISHLVKYESITENVIESKACLEAFIKIAKEKGFNVMTTKNLDVAIIEMGEGEETLGILAHLDVVDIGDLEKWETNPFELIVKDNYIYGRGTEDDKGACIMSLYAMEAVKNLNLPFKRKVQLIIGTKEEAEWTDIESFKEEFKAPDFGFSPDGSFPIYNEEKGYADVILTFKEEGIKEIKAGESYNTIPSKAEITLTNRKVISAEGKSSHSSTPETGDNAVVKLAKELEQEEETKNKDFVKFINTYLEDPTYGRKLSIDEKSTTAVPTVLSITDKDLKLVINIRHEWGTKEEDIKRAFTNLSKEYNFTFTIKGYLEPMYVDENKPFLQEMNKVHEEYNIKGGFKAAAGSSYAKSMENFVSWGPVMEEEESTAHMENERLSIDAMILGTKMYASYIYKIAIEQGD